MHISYSDPLLLREIIMDHYQNPRNYKEIKDEDSSFISIHMDHSDNCTDDIYIHVKLDESSKDSDNDQKVIKECYWSGHACAISTASASIMTELVIDHTIKEAKKMMTEFNLMMENKHYDEDLLEEANCFKNTYRQPSRIGCATISWRGLDKVFEEVEDSSTSSNKTE